MKILIACEYSGIVRDAFIQKGHDAISCDILPTESAGPHVQGNVLDLINDNLNWDMLIGFPPCTYLTYAATAHWNNPGRCGKRIKALEFFRRLYEAPINKICIENPRGCASPTIAKYTQIIQPYYFGDPHVKTTCLWLKNLPALIHFSEDGFFEKRTHTDKPEPVSIDNTPRKKKRYFENSTRDPKQRSKFWPGIAKAMADQWGSTK